MWDKQDRIKVILLPKDKRAFFYPSDLLKILSTIGTKRISSRFCRISREALEKKMVSTANCKRDTLVLSLPTMKLSNGPLSSFLVIILLRISTIRVKRKGERGSPCLNHLVALTQPLILQLTKIAKLIEDASLV